MSQFKKLQNEIEIILSNSPLDFEIAHSRLTLERLIKLKPEADEALQIAAIAHDMERGITKITEKDLQDLSKFNEFKKEHCMRSAEHTKDVLLQHRYSQNIIDKVTRLISNHEFGGDEDGNVLMDADSLAYFSYNIPSGLKRNGRERTKEKIKFMYIRVSDLAKKFVREMTFSDPEITDIFKEAINEIKEQ